ncbi:MAG: DUF4870 domain-containing protein [Myxococcota bacterium]
MRDLIAELEALRAHSPSSEEKTWALFAHLGGLVLFVIAPLVVMLTEGTKSPWVRWQAVSALNFQLTLFIVGVVSFVGSFLIGLIPVVGAIAGLAFICLPVVLGLGWLILTIIGGVKAYGGALYEYPASFHLVK